MAVPGCEAGRSGLAPGMGFGLAAWRIGVRARALELAGRIAAKTGCKLIAE